MASCHVEHFDDAAVRYRCIGVERDELLGILLLCELKECDQLVVAEGLGLFVAEGGEETLLLVDIYFCAWLLDGGLLRTLREVDFESGWRDKRGCHHKKYEQQEYHVGHRCHAIVG